MDNSEIKHKFKKFKKYSKILFREIKEKMEEKNVNLALLAKLNGDLEKCVLILKSYLAIIDPENIKKEKHKIDKLGKFTTKVNQYVNTRLTNNDTAKLLDVVEKINSKIMHDNKILKEINSNTYKPNMFNSPFMPGTAMAYNGRKSVPVANPLGTAALGMASSLSLSLSDPLDTKAESILEAGPQKGDINVLAATPMMIDPRASPEPSLRYPEPIVRHGRDTSMPISLSQPVIGMQNSLTSILGPVGAMGPIAPANLPIISPGLGGIGGIPMPGIQTMGVPTMGVPTMGVPTTGVPVSGFPIIGGYNTRKPYDTKY
jgi:hypothetical protein